MRGDRQNLTVVTQSGYLHASDLRALLRQALAEMGEMPLWEERAPGHMSLPKKLRKADGPFIALGDEILAAIPSDPAEFPTAGEVASLIRAGRKKIASRRTNPLKRINLSIIPTILIILLPKCPMCWAAYMGAFSALGFGELSYQPWLLPFMVCVLFISIGAMYWRGRKGNGYGPFVLGLLGAFLVVGGRFVLKADWVMYTGMTFILLSSIWNGMPRGTLNVILPQALKAT